MALPELNGLTAVGVLLVGSFWMGRLANRAGLPRISGYLAAGIILGPSLLGAVPGSTVSGELSWITSLALCIIGYSIGGSLEYRRLSHLGSSIAWITASQAVGALVITGTSMLLLFHMAKLTPLLGVESRAALLLGAISVATAPGAVLAVISELRARGPFTNTLLGVVALDDGVTLVLFAIAAACVQMMGASSSGPGRELLIALWEVGGSLLLGMAGGGALKLMGASIFDRETLLMITIAILSLIAGLSPLLHLSPILGSMTTGAFVVNWEPRHNLFFEAMDAAEATVFGLFFSLAGARLELHIFLHYLPLSLALLVARFVGKQMGVWVGAALSRPIPAVRRFLGLGLFPQAGVTVGLVLLAQKYLPSQAGSLVLNVVIGAVVVNEIISPPLLKLCLRWAGEAEA